MRDYVEELCREPLAPRTTIGVGGARHVSVHSPRAPRGAGPGTPVAEARRMTGNSPRVRSLRARRRASRQSWRVARRFRQASNKAPAASVTHHSEAGGDFEAEISSLRPFAGSLVGSSRQPSAQLGASPLSRSERLRRITFVCAMLALALLGASGKGPALLSLLAAGHTVASAPLVETLAQSGGIVCLRDTAWSPDSRYVAFAGNGQECNPDHFVPAQIDVYDARTHRLARQLHPDAPVLEALRAAPDPQSSSSGYRPQVITYQSLLWSPDGKRLALTFLAVASWDPAQYPFDGVLVMDADGSAPRVLLRRETSGARGSLYLEWDLAEGRAMIARQMPPIGPPPLTAAPALAYAWQDGDTAFVPLDTLSGNSPTLLGDLSPVGNPSGGTTVSIWQPGWLELDWETGAGDIHAAGLYTWRTAFSAWSPDGRYLVDLLGTAAQIEPLGFRAPDRPLVNNSLSQLPLLPVRDAGLEHVLEGLIDTPHSAGPPAPWLAWRPDGRVLAAQDAVGVAFYDCATGKLLNVRTPPAAQVTLSGEPAVARWSPDGTMLALPNGALLSVGSLGM